VIRNVKHAVHLMVVIHVESVSIESIKPLVVIVKKDTMIITDRHLIVTNVKKPALNVHLITYVQLVKKA
jgi:hypothetical protein